MHTAPLSVNEEQFYTTTTRKSPEQHWFSNWYQKIRDAMSNLKRRLGFTTSNVTTGLDTNTHFFYGTKEPFQDYVQAIYPGKIIYFFLIESVLKSLYY